MNKVLNNLRYILYLITIILLIIFNIKFGLSLEVLSLYISFVVLLIINIRDIKYKRSIGDRFNILYCISMLITIFLLYRVLFDTSLIINSKNHINILQSINNNIIKEFAINFLSQNIYYLLIIYICLIFYRFIDKKDKINYKYSSTSIICLIINIILLLETIKLLVEPFNINHFPLLLFAINTILLVVEIASLIINNKIKKEWIIYLSFIFNLFAYISIFT